MIEVEKKFNLKGDDEKRLINGAEFICETVFTDVYYDNAGYSLTTNDKWLRSRNNNFELKLSLDKNAERVGDLYEEIENDAEIKKILNLSDVGSMEASLEEDGYSKFCTCKTTRKKYKKNGFGIDVDFVEYNDDFIYELAEIEIMVEDKSEMAKALEKIIDFAKENNLEIGYVRGKVLVYLKNRSPDHFQALVKSGVIKE
jgi:thiamine-triphosphatase